MFFIILAFIDVEVDNFRALRESTFGESPDVLEAARKRALARRQAGELVMEFGPEAIFNSGIRLKVLLQKFADYTRCCENDKFITTTECGQNIFLQKTLGATEFTLKNKLPASG